LYSLQPRNLIRLHIQSRNPKINPKMSSSSFSYSSSSYTSSSSTNNNGSISGTKNATYKTSDPSGTTVQTTSQNLGEPAISETRSFDAQGREMIGGGAAGSDRMIGTGNNRVEDVTESEADREYRERMEDEYAKREGGA
ncbi:hypothetical protein K402DRAFT_393880, partial [Aulographum hederae CBS 113979]